jgi:pSer/pThr/pTyr-binding forkhead associated (FHA) protein
MIEFYILVALIVTATIPAVMLLTRSQRARHGAGAGRPEVVAPATVVMLNATPPDFAAHKDAFDAGATMIHSRSSPTAQSVAGQARPGDAPAANFNVRLVGVAGSLKGSSFVVAAEGISVGRSPYANIVLRDPRVSLRHAWIGIVDGKVVVRDLKSTNGTYLNAHTSARITETTLRPGDTVFFGSHQGDQFRLVTH